MCRFGQNVWHFLRFPIQDPICNPCHSCHWNCHCTYFCYFSCLFNHTIIFSEIQEGQWSGHDTSIQWSTHNTHMYIIKQEAAVCQVVVLNKTKNHYPRVKPGDIQTRSRNKFFIDKLYLKVYNETTIIQILAASRYTQRHTTGTRKP